MDSPKQARPKSTPKTITLEGGIKIPVSGASRCTPTSKSSPAIKNQVPFKAAVGG